MATSSANSNVTIASDRSRLCSRPLRWIVSSVCHTPYPSLIGASSLPHAYSMHPNASGIGRRRLPTGCYYRRAPLLPVHYKQSRGVSGIDLKIVVKASYAEIKI
ncbi:hypothetical protein EVAR_4830_1 [Eumeta japonica]|uniref:Uncharacterized protein n=1 Tax=Eumeta variegata TaxID=151549 RepID=A0A4C1SZX0_EUMVA|nr:hypothetical protein EVAR_4830_1 [Eumeta japonica]